MGGMTKRRTFTTRPETGGAILVLTRVGSHGRAECEQEFADLASSAGVLQHGVVRCRNRCADPAHFVGPGKAAEIGEQVCAAGVSLVVIDCELSPRQTRNLETRVSARVLDRTALILDIFAQRARSHEGKLQVELAQLEYLSTRLVRTWSHLERQKGGIGLRGPGEKQLETDRRLLRRRMNSLAQQLEKIKQQRDQRRRRRTRNLLPSISLVGYTNAGKSTLFNALTNAGVVSSGRLFATLDPTVRRFRIDGLDLLLSDTVGFIRDLPHQLIDAFNATLLEIRRSDLILCVEDASLEEGFDRRREVNRVLSLIGAGDIPRIVVLNKIDRAGLAPGIRRTANGRAAAVHVSAATGCGIELLKQAIVEQHETLLRRFAAGARGRGFDRAAGSRLSP